MNKIRYDPVVGTVIYKTEMVQGPDRNFEIFEPLDFLAAVTCHIPNRGEHLVRYYVVLQRAARPAPARRRCDWCILRLDLGQRSRAGSGV